MYPAPSPAAGSPCGRYVLLSALVLLTPSWAGTGPGETFRASGGVRILKDLLNTPSAWAKIQGLGERLALWRLSATTLEEQEECSLPAVDGSTRKAVHLVFEYGSHFRRSSRVYEVSFSACRPPPGRLTRFTLERERFASSTELGEAPLARDRTSLSILKNALNDAEVFHELELFELEARMDHLEIKKQPSSAGPVAVYQLLVASASPQAWDGETRVLKYTVLYDFEVDTMTFLKED